MDRKELFFRAKSELIDIYSLIGNIEAAVAHSKSLEEWLSRHWDISRVKEVLLQRSNILVDLGEYEKCMDIFDTVLADKSVTHKEEAHVLTNIGCIHIVQGDLKLAEEKLSQSMKIFHQIGEKQSEAVVWNHLSRVYNKMGKWSQGLICTRKSLAIAEEENLFAEIAYSYNQMANYYGQKGLVDKALDLYKTAFNCFKKIFNLDAMAMTLNNIGFIHSQSDNLKEAIRYIKRALKYIEKTGKLYPVALCSFNLGRLLWKLGDESAAESYLLKSLENSNLLGDTVGIIEAFCAIADIYWQSDPAKAKKLYKKAIEAAGKKFNKYIPEEARERV